MLAEKTKLESLRNRLALLDSNINASTSEQEVQLWKEERKEFLGKLKSELKSLFTKAAGNLKNAENNTENNDIASETADYYAKYVKACYDYVTVCDDLKKIDSRKKNLEKVKKTAVDCDFANTGNIHAQQAILDAMNINRFLVK